MQAPAPFDCLSCGACCAYYRVSFYAGECDSHTPNGVPIDSVEPISPFRVSMKGTNQKTIRCVELKGKVGEGVHCGIYTQRSSACRDFTAGSEGCIKARAHYQIGIDQTISIPSVPLLPEQLIPVIVC